MRLTVQSGAYSLGSQGLNRKCNQFPWFYEVPCRSCLLPIRYKSSVEYYLPFWRLLQCISKMGPKRLAWMPYMMFYNAINKPRNVVVRKVTNHLCSKIRPLWNPFTDKVGKSFYLRNQKTALDSANWCKPGVSMVRITTECGLTDLLRTSSNESEQLPFPWFAPGVHPTRLGSWKPIDYTPSRGFSHTDAVFPSTG